MPKAVLVFPVCLHHFMGCDLHYVYGELEKRFPDIVFVRCWMDPIMQKSGPTPDQKLRRAMMDLVMDGDTLKKKFRSADAPSSAEDIKPAKPLVFLGDLIGLDPENELMRLARSLSDTSNGQNTDDPNRNHHILQIQDCRTLDEYRDLGAADIMACRTMTAYPSLIATARRLDKTPLYLPQSFDYDQIRRMLFETANAAGMAEKADTKHILLKAGIDPDAEKEACETALHRAHEIIGETPVLVDSIAVEKPLSLCRFLLEHGFQVQEVYLDGFSPQEEEDYRWLCENAPQLYVCGTVQPERRVLHGLARNGARTTILSIAAEATEPNRILAIGPKAAWFAGTPYFVNMVYDGGLWGYSGIRKLADMMVEAFMHEKDTRDLVPRKGLGCACILPREEGR